MTKVIDWMKGIYGSHMKESRGKKQNYLGMDLEFSVDGKVRGTMMYYLKKILSGFPATIQGRLVTPAAEHLFIVRGDADRKLLENIGPLHSIAHSRNSYLPIPALGNIYRHMCNLSLQG